MFRSAPSMSQMATSAVASLTAIGVLDTDIPLCTGCDVDVVVSRAVVADILQTLRQSIKQLRVEVSGNWIRVVASVKGVYTVKFTTFAL